MRYSLRTTFTLTAAQHDLADTFLQWLYETLPTAATLGETDAVPQWLGNRYPESNAVFEVSSQYPNVFAATADRLRITTTAATNPFGVAPPTFEVLRVYGDTEMGTRGDAIKPHSSPC